MFLSVFRKNLDGIHHGIIDHGYKREFDSAAGGRLDMVEGLYDRRRAALREDVKVLHQHFAVGGNVKYPASGATDASVLFAKPRLAKIKPHPVIGPRHYRNAIAEAANAIGLV